MFQKDNARTPAPRPTAHTWSSPSCAPMCARPALYLTLSTPTAAPPTPLLWCTDCCDGSDEPGSGTCSITCGDGQAPSALALAVRRSWAESSARVRRCPGGTPPDTRDVSLLTATTTTTTTTVVVAVVQQSSCCIAWYKCPSGTARASERRQEAMSAPRAAFPTHVFPLARQVLNRRRPRVR